MCRIKKNTELVSMVHDIVSGRVVINESIISIEVQLMKVIEHCERLLATLPNDVIDRFNTTTGVFGQIHKTCQCAGEAALRTDPGNDKIPGMPFVV